jgi:hypothetical protein
VIVDAALVEEVCPIAVVKSKFPLWSIPSAPEPLSSDVGLFPLPNAPSTSSFWYPLPVILDVVDCVWLMRVATFVVVLEAVPDVDVCEALTNVVVVKVVVDV